MSTLPIVIRTTEGLVITVKQGCITKEKADVIINSTTDTLQLDAGTLSASILKAAGSVIQDECSQKSPNKIKRGQVVDTTAGQLPSNTIYHGSVSPWLNGNGEADLLAFVRCFLDKADVEGKTSMAIPAVSTGVLEFPPAVVAKVIHQEIVKFSKAMPRTSLKDIRINLVTEPQLTEFSKYFSTVPSEPAQSTLNGTSRKGNQSGLGVPAEISEYVEEAAVVDQEAEVVNEDAAAVDEEAAALDEEAAAVDDVDTLASVKIKHGLHIRIKKGNISEAKTDVIVNVTTKDLRLNHGAITSSILRAAGKDIEGECKEKAPGGIEYGGLVESSGGQLNCKAIYHVAVTPWANDSGPESLQALICKVLKKAEDDCHTSVALPSIGTGLILQYPAKVVARSMIKGIERFCTTKQPSSLRFVEIILFEKDKKSTNAFLSYMSAKYNINTAPKKGDIETPMSIPLPPAWSSMKADELYKAEPLSNSSDEYQSVYKRFTESGGPKNVKQIQRIQCPNMYQLFLVRRGQLEKTISDRKKFKVEETLYHGTSQDALGKINIFGFNRSFCGRNATILGYGTYFAKEASYSCNDVYSPRDKDGYRHVYQCRVLTGEYAKGSSDLKVPPPKDPNNPLDLYDTVVNDVSNPTVFVVFYDAQAYPEYLITFKN